MADPKTPNGRKIRVLLDTAEFQINDTPHLSDEEAAAAVTAGWADDSPAAVEYAEGLGAARAARAAQ